ncbi:phosphoglucosamine mutase [Algibacillus agarilyticus]|uniref:phosphoglucosamine mutase n=1 Tax=Algibacillus agarilyticus TaxID=2234133 RepID=UPI0018E4F2DF|nr:phosphoglucosamine mutase [Algibacillus agarilyticus]
MEKRYFGTDGIRGTVGKGKITPAFVMKLGWAVGRVLTRQGNKNVLIGKDTRISGYMFESALEAGLSAAGVDVRLLGPMPTPAIAYLTRAFRADAGIVISASHNPYYDNGIKFFSAQGMKLDDDIELAIEAELDLEMTVEESNKLGRALRIDDAAGRYIEFCKSRFPSDMSLKGLKIVVDCAHGATYHIAPKVLEELGADIITIGVSPNGLNINEDCGATSLKALQAKVISESADLGFALDGDGDRIMMVDDRGQVVDGDQIMFVMARDALKSGTLDGGAVGTLMSNLGLEVALKNLGIPFSRSKVGDRYVLAMLQEKGWSIGAENSGHVLDLKQSTTGDGIVAGLQVLKAIINTGLSLRELCGGMTLYPQVLINLRYKEGQDSPLEAAEVLKITQEVEVELGETGRVLLRKSGTEPLVRVMVEGKDQDLVQQSAEKIAEVVKECINK